VANDDVPANYVVRQDPPPLVSVREGTKVRLVLSKGPPESVRVPNFTGQSIDEARTLAQKDHIHLGQIVWTPLGRNGPPRGQIVRQNPGPGAHLDPFQEVSLQVSAGPGEYGYLVRQTHIAVTVPVRDDAANVRIELIDETGTWNLYNGFAQGAQKLDFNVTAVGTAVVDTYINNELLNQTVIGKEPPTPKPSAAPKGQRAP
jgi:serine/threonine-protein kinase